MVWAFDVEAIPSSQKFVLVALANFASETGKCYPSVQTICRITNQQEGTVRKALQDLVSSGVITDTGKKTGATHQVKIYQLPDGACFRPAVEGVFKDQREDSAKTPAKTIERPTETGGRVINKEQGTRNKEEGAVAPAVKPQKHDPPEVKELQGGFKAAWAERFGGPYSFNGVVDAEAARKLVALKIPVAQLLSIAKRAWDKPQEWNCKHAMTLRGFASRFNEIRAEVGAVNGAAKTHTFTARGNL